MTDDVHSYLTNLGASEVPAPDPEFATHLELELRSMRAQAMSPRFARPRRWPATVAAVTFSFAVIAFGLATIETGTPAIAISAANGASVVLPDGQVVDAEPGMELEEGGVIVVDDAGGSAVIGDIELGPGQVAEITPEGIVLAQPDGEVANAAKIAHDNKTAGASARQSNATAAPTTGGASPTTAAPTSAEPAPSSSEVGTDAEDTTTTVDDAPTSTGSTTTEAEPSSTTTSEPEPVEETTTTAPPETTEPPAPSTTTSEPGESSTTTTEKPDPSTTTTTRPDGQEDPGTSTSTTEPVEETTTTTTDPDPAAGDTTTTTIVADDGSTGDTTTTTAPPDPAEGSVDPDLMSVLVELRPILNSCQISEAELLALAVAVAEGTMTPEEAAAVIACGGN